MIADAKARVRLHIEAAAKLYDEREALLPALVQSTGLSPEGVRFAWERSYERSISESDLETLIAEAAPAASVLAVLSSNVFVAPVRALACALARSAHVFVKPSRREPHLVRALVRLEPELGMTLLTDAEASVFQGEVHVYGRKATIDAYRTSLPASSQLVSHGPGFGVAYVGPDADLDQSAARIADDIVLFEQRGCLSPRVTFVEGPTARASEFARFLVRRLESHPVPRGHVSEEEEAEIRSFARTAEVVGELFEGKGVRVAACDTFASPLIAPNGRNMYVASMAAAEGDPLGSIAPFVTVLGSDHDVPWRPRGARLAPLGRMQSPPLDGPVDMRGRERVTP
ncbi:MAG: acyl-CoA reductase [Polyangiaceae bacterium]